LAGYGIEEQLPTIMIVAHYDSYGVAPVGCCLALLSCFFNFFTFTLSQWFTNWPWHHLLL